MHCCAAKVCAYVLPVCARLSHSLTHKHSTARTSKSTRDGTSYARELRSAGTCFQVNIALTLEQVRVDRHRR